MTKWLISYSHKTGARWNVVEFGGKTKAEARGIVDLIAIRKDHRREAQGLKRGDLFEIVLIQTKGGTALRPTNDDIVRLKKVARHHRAKVIVLAEWHRKKELNLFQLVRNHWKQVDPSQIFG